MVRDILKIDEELCTGCGLCVPNCHEGALQLIDGKARLVSELMCDGLGACIGYCPEGAISVERRETEPYNETRVMEIMISKGKNTISAHLKHLKEHGETGYLEEGVDYLKKHRDKLEFNLDKILTEINENMKYPDQPANRYNGNEQNHKGCPGTNERVIAKPEYSSRGYGDTVSELRQWPVQMHLINPEASYYKGSDLLLAADCTAYCTGEFHSRHLRGKSLAIACPKLDQNTSVYVEKIKALIDIAEINTVTVLLMEVPCCGGLLKMVNAAALAASRKVPVKKVILGISGEILHNEWI
ncbi:MAG: 4Fe-4S binding protein [Bacteroidales bacterium]|jgi:NAD-dependent dihydropyrimidine dehydrogenase PreA subunit|nr:4Fe-4S binding protein [Bacteroidales bacterium]